MLNSDFVLLPVDMRNEDDGDLASSCADGGATWALDIGFVVAPSRRSICPMIVRQAAGADDDVVVVVVVVGGGGTEGRVVRLTRGSSRWGVKCQKSGEMREREASCWDDDDDAAR